MAFVTVPKDLSKVKTKVALNLTKRQLICFGAAAIIGIPVYIFTRGAIGNSTAALLMIALMFPLFFVGIYEKDGQPAEVILRNIIRTRFAWPGKRPYKTENLYEILTKEGENIAHQNKQQQKRLSANIRQVKANRKDARKPQKSPNAQKTPPVKNAGCTFFERIFGGKAPRSAQESITYREMYRDGICRVTDRLYSKTIEFGDINYHLAQN